MERNHRLAAAIAVIATGTVLLLTNLHLIKTHEIGRYWPSLLIVIGFGKLVADRGRGGSSFTGNRALFADSCENSHNSSR